MNEWSVLESDIRYLLKLAEQALSYLPNYHENDRKLCCFFKYETIIRRGENKYYQQTSQLRKFL